MHNIPTYDGQEITPSMMDYAYINECSDSKILEKILIVLRSGSEGFYPHLINHCEERLQELKPNSKLLRKENNKTFTRDLEADLKNGLEKDLQNWKLEMELSNHEKSDINTDIPPIRVNTHLNGSRKTELKKQKRINSYDYKSWDKFDVDKECEIIDLENSNPKIPKQKPTLSTEIDSSNLNHHERLQRAEAEKNKGNEAFKSCDYEEALTYYSRSLGLFLTTACINNRALVYLRLKKWNEACEDCNKVLRIEPENLKAKLRRATAYKEMGKLNEAWMDLKFVLEKEPNNQRVQKIMAEIKKIKEKGNKLVVEDASSSDEENHSNNTEVVIEKRSDDEVAGGDNKQPAVVQVAMPTKVATIKQVANNLIRSGMYAEAVEKYNSGIQILNKMVSDNKDPKSSYDNCLAIMLSNRSLCHLKVGDDSSCISDCKKVLSLEPFHVKALMRRATAYEHTEKYADAYVDYHTAYLVDRNASQAQNGFNRMATVLRSTYGNTWRDKLPKMPQVPLNISSKPSISSLSPPSVDVTVSTSSNNLKDDKDSVIEKAADAEKEVENDEHKKKYEEVKRNLFLSVKNKGNQSVKDCNYKDAIECYTRCIQFYPDEVVSYTNRALCYLKVKDFHQVINDCSKALQLDASNIKAFYRRATALKNLSRLVEAEDDLVSLINIDPCNKTAASELKVLRNLIASSKSSKMKKVVVTEVDYSSDEDEVKPLKSEDQKKQREEIKSSEAKSKPSEAKIKSSEAKIKSSEAKIKSSEAKIKPSEAKIKCDNKQNGVERRPITSPYEFGHRWSLVKPKTNILAYKKVLDEVIPEQLPRLLSNKIDEHLIIVTAKAVRLYLNDDKQTERAYKILFYLAQAKRFGISSMFLTDENRCVIAETFELLSEEVNSQDHFTKENLSNLRIKYTA